ncbi:MULTISPECIES: ethanolamine utilization protein [unclassified Granulicatella]|uniref:ethanolamine utilization protein n=1 Tax=unclassified Granulicatella TaxID=2630493 RepID=UPI0010740D1C|nr:MULTISPECIES: ethanolamine utilization protein [unclassified Granulicatella]MBF0780127.1 ethanolamine utilization protein [Granulicatella sp. 19428wC4_WM01]TFU95793.1 ethanolamine utilization protein [Granulicatella sp. WM01]
MENVDKLVQLITDRLLENLQHAPTNKSVLLIGGTSKNVDALEKAGYVLVDDLQLTTEYIVVESIQTDSLLRIASLCPTTQEESALVKGLLQGKAVYVLNSALQLEAYKKTATPLLFKELLNQKQKLEKYGVKFCDNVDFIASTEPVTPHNQVDVSSSQQVVKSDKKSKLITEAKLKDLNLREGDVFVAAKGTIVTSLAKDYLKRHKITLQNEK